MTTCAHCDWPAQVTVNGKALCLCHMDAALQKVSPVVLDIIHRLAH